MLSLILENLQMHFISAEIFNAVVKSPAPKYCPRKEANLSFTRSEAELTPYLIMLYLGKMN